MGLGGGGDSFRGTADAVGSENKQTRYIKTGLTRRLHCVCAFSGSGGQARRPRPTQGSRCRSVRVLVECRISAVHGVPSFRGLFEVRRRLRA